MRIAELFASIQGEGRLAGVPSLFIRFSGCNLRCRWCDTPYTSWHPEGADWTLDRIMECVREYPQYRHAVVTGGEPMIFPEVVPLTQELQAAGLHVTMETAGTVFQAVACDLMSVSPKLANSTPDDLVWRPRHEERRLQPDVLRRLTSDFDYQLKFVVQSPGDLAEIRAIQTLCGASEEKILLMPEGVDAATLEQRSAWLVELCKQYGYRFAPRLHILLYGHRRGV
ncbi:MAG: 7-carboxy-7-deazaguanine synthase QueE [Bryobacteraceae bacterium]